LLADPDGIAAGPDGNLWFTVNYVTMFGGPNLAGRAAGVQLGHITPAGGTTLFPILPEAVNSGGIAGGPDGHIWVTESTQPSDFDSHVPLAPGPISRIGRITPAGIVSQFDVPTSDGGPAGIAAGPDGALWFAEQRAGKVGRLEPDRSLIAIAAPIRAT